MRQHLPTTSMKVICDFISSMDTGDASIASVRMELDMLDGLLSYHDEAR
jgi:hypothetical protein